MRALTEKETKKRGCRYCTDRFMHRNAYGSMQGHCPHEECPYHELDKYDTYKEYLKKEGIQINLSKLGIL
jgi:hypothetical protein